MTDILKFLTNGNHGMEIWRMEIRFVYIFKLSHNSRSFPLSSLTWFKPQCWYLVFTWINQFKLICFLRYFWKIFLKEKGIFSNSEIRGKKSCAFIAHMGALMRRNKIILVYKWSFFTFLFLDTTIPQSIPLYLYRKARKSK